jgi:hypothetical protein
MAKKPGLFDFRQVPTYPLPKTLQRALARALPQRPDDPDDPPEERIEVALEAVAGLCPRNAVEAMLAIQFVVGCAAALDTFEQAADAALEAEAVRRLRGTANALQRSADRARQALLKLQSEPEPAALASEVVKGWDCDLPALAALRRKTAPPAEKAAAKPAARPWGNKRYWHELTNEELAAVKAAQARGEAVNITYKPGDPALLFTPDPRSSLPYKRWEDMTMEERRQRYGYRHEDEIAAEKAAKGNGAAG